MQTSRAFLLARALCERARTAKTCLAAAALVRGSQKSRRELLVNHGHQLEDVELYASLALDHFDQARLRGDMSLAKSIVAGLDELFRRSGVIWIGIEAQLGAAEIARLSLNQAKDRDFESAAAGAERAAYYGWRSGALGGILPSVHPSGSAGICQSTGSQKRAFCC
jgi:hypothetical protein